MTPQTEIHLLLGDYARWTASMWSGEQPLGVRDLAVMSLGVPGECAEVAELVVANSLDHRAICKELGDVLYYWARLCEVLSIDLTAVWPSEEGLPPPQSRLALSLELCLAAGQVAEAMKKHVREDASTAAASNELVVRLTTALRRLATAWLQVASLAGLDLHGIVAHNREKLTDRQARNVLKGSGDDR